MGEPCQSEERHAGTVITDDDDTIAAALADVSVPTLLMSMVHITGDPSWIRGEDIPVGVYLNEVQGFMEPDAQDRVRARALAAISSWRDPGARCRIRLTAELLAR